MFKHKDVFLWPSGIGIFTRKYDNVLNIQRTHLTGHIIKIIIRGLIVRVPFVKLIFSVIKVSLTKILLKKAFCVFKKKRLLVNFTTTMTTVTLNFKRHFYYLYQFCKICIFD